MSAAEPRSSNATIALAVLVAALVLVAWLNRFVQDDAFISFRYAHNLVEGHGLTFNPGERVEGYTNFLWTLLIAAGLAAGFEPVAFSQALGLVFFAGSLYLTYRLAADLAGAHAAGLLAALLLGTNYSFSAYATGGLETQSQAFFVVAAVWASRVATARAGIGWSGSAVAAALASLAYGAAILTRLDSAVCLAVPGLMTLWLLARAPGPPAARALRVSALVVPAALLVGAWLAWKVQYYGDMLPNTFYVKVASAASWARGVHYVVRFFASYWLLPLVLLAVVARPRRLRAMLRDGARPWPVTLAASAAVWFLYVASVGGDFMEFRFIVPVLPLVMTLLALGLWSLVDEPVLRRALVGVVLAGSLFHAFTFWGVRDIESTRNLAVHLEADGGDWDAVGRALGRHFDAADGVVIAVGPAGAIPYYSRLESVDMRGLVDAWVARNGIVVSTVPGHQRMAPLGYLIDRGVNLVVGHPQVAGRDAGLPEAFTVASLAQYGLVDATAENLPPGARIVAVPVDGERWLLTLYLVPHPAIDRRIAEDGWPTVPLRAEVRSF